MKDLREIKPKNNQELHDFLQEYEFLTWRFPPLGSYIDASIQGKALSLGFESRSEVHAFQVTSS